MTTHNKGTTVAWSLTVLLAVSTAFAAGHIWVSSLPAIASGYHDGVKELSDIEIQTSEVIHALESDWTPEAESSHDIVWSRLRSLDRSGSTASLTDLSSDGLERVYINANAAAPELLEKLFLDRGMPADSATRAAEELRRWQRVKSPFSDDDLRGLLGSSYRKVYPFVSTLPEINVNFASKERVMDAFSFRRRAEQDLACARVAAELVRERETTEITDGVLAGLMSRFGVDRREVPNLGVHTWLWQIASKRGDRRHLVRVVRLASRGRAEYRVVGSCWAEDQGGKYDQSIRN